MTYPKKAVRHRIARGVVSGDCLITASEGDLPVNVFRFGAKVQPMRNPSAITYPFHGQEFSL